MQHKNVLVIGNFDGVHPGHVALIQKGKELAQQHHAQLTVLTFDPHPRAFFGDTTFFPLFTLAQKLDALKQAGATHIVVEAFNAEFAQQSPAAFMDYLVTQHNAVAVCVGNDFRFGAKAVGTVADLMAHTAFETIVLADVCDDAGVRYSSTRLRVMRDKTMQKKETA